MPDTIYTIRVFKSVVVRPEIIWANTYEYSVAEPLNYDQAEQLGAAVITNEVSFHTSAISFDRVTLSTWVADSAPYNPDNLFTFAGAGITGDQTANFASSEVLDTVFWVKRIAASGRNGRIFYRGVLFNDDTQENAQKKPALTTAGTSRLNALLIAVKASMLQPFPGVNMVMAGVSQTSKTLQAAAVNQVQQTVYTYGPPRVRQVFDLATGGVTRSKLDHNYFDLGV